MKMHTRRERVALARYWRSEKSHDRFAVNRVTVRTIKAIYDGSYRELNPVIESITREPQVVEQSSQRRIWSEWQ